MENNSSKISNNLTDNSSEEMEGEVQEKINTPVKNLKDEKSDVETLIQFTIEKIFLKITNTNSFLETNMIKKIVSKKKCRFEYEGFSLDLSYITERIIAMGFPTEDIDKLYRNSITDVKRFFTKRHPNKYKVYNLCSEREYEENTFEKEAYFPFDDHQAPSLKLILPFCIDVEEWLKADPENIAAIHCLAGKGRTGTMICCYLMYSNFLKSADDAIKFYGRMRTTNGKGVTIPSQLRYIYYFEEILKIHSGKNLNNFLIQSPCVYITKIKFFTIPNYNSFASKICTPYFIIENQGSVFDYKKNSLKGLKSFKNEADAEFIVNNFRILGDVKITFYHKNSFGKDKMFTFWFHTYMIPKEGVWQIKKSMLDKACKDVNNKFYDPNFKVEIQYTYEI